ncbi:hypothetical protein [Allokutzneria multivorans]|uniref:hypothetical protein n=1 Tax=Allokutzneria multivorans TaxID=1142134 RepID=UPI0031EE7DCA
MKLLLFELLEYGCISLADVVASTQQSTGGVFRVDVVQHAANATAQFVWDGVIIAGDLEDDGDRALSVRRAFSI